MAEKDLQFCDLILISDYVLTMDEKSSVIRDGAVVIRDKKIEAIGVKKGIEELYQAKEKVNCGRAIIMPGLINTHTHVAMSYFRGLADDLPLEVWWNNHIFPAEKKLVDPEFIRLFSSLSCLDMILSGTTCFNDMYFFAAETAAVAETAGMRAGLGECAIDFPTPCCAGAEAAFAMTRELAQKYRNSELISAVINLHAPYTCGRSTIEAALRLQEETSLPVRMHVAETKKELAEAKKNWGKSPVARLDDFRFLSPDLMAVHCVWLEESDKVLFQEHGVKISHNPKSNLKLGSGIAPAAQLLECGLIVALGTDGAASNNTQDMFSEMRTCALVHKGANLDPETMPAKTVVRLASCDAAAAIGQADRIGSLEPGKAADLVVLDLDNAHSTPIYDPYSHIVYAAEASDVRDVMVNGKWLVRNRIPLTFDRERIIDDARKFQESVK